MKVTSGMTHPLSGQGAWRHAPGASGTRARHPPGRPAGVRPAAAPPAARRQAGAPRGLRRVALLSLVASAALLGCSSLPSAPWRVEPAYRVDSAATAQGYLALALQYEGEQRTLLALDAYRKAALAAPGDAEVQGAVGVALARHGQFAAAVKVLRQAVALAPERAPLLNNLAYALLLDGRAEDARAMFRLTLAVEPTHGPALHNLAHVEQQIATAAARSAPQPAVVAELAGPAAPGGSATPAAPAISAVPAVSAEVARAPAPAQPPEAAPTAPSAVAPAAIAVTAPAAPTAAAIVPAQAPALVRNGLEGVGIEIINGNGINGVAARMRALLRERGIEVERLANRVPYESPRTMVLYRPGKGDAALQLAQRMPVDADVGPASGNSTRADLSVVLGHDVRKSAGCAVLAACGAADRVVSSVEPGGHGPEAERKLRR